MTKLGAMRRRDISTVFLETTIQIQRFLETPERRAEIRANLVKKRVCTSSYVFMEFQRTLLKDLAYVRSAVASDCPVTADGKVFLRHLMAEMRRPRPGHSKRSIERSIMVIELIMEVFEETRIKKSRLLEYLDSQIEDLREGFLEVDLMMESGEILKVESSNLTDCDLVKSGSCQCRREEAQCQLPSFLARHADIILQVRQAFEEAAKRRRGESSKPKMAAAADRILAQQPTDWHRAKGQYNCWPLGDTIIALEAPQDAAIYTIDHHFDVICPIVDRYIYDEVTLLPRSPARSQDSRQSSA